MAIFKMVEESSATGKVKEVFEDIKSSRGITEIPNFWKMLANDPAELERSWNSLKQVMRKGALDPITKELIYVAVSITNSCEYCTKSHSYAAKKKGATNEMLKIALKYKPNFVCIVPEKRNEITTEGGLNITKNKKIIKKVISKLNSKKIRTSLFINPNIKDVFASKELNAKCVELHTGKFALKVKNNKNYLEIGRAHV